MGTKQEQAGTQGSLENVLAVIFFAPGSGLATPYFYVTLEQPLSKLTWMGNVTGFLKIVLFGEYPHS